MLLFDGAEVFYNQCAGLMFTRPTIVTITGIRPDFIRMKEVFRLLDERSTHVMLHTGQHYDDELSRVFFQDLSIRTPDFTLETGRHSRTQYDQLSYLSKAVPDLLKAEGLTPDLILFLGDSNSAMVSAPLFKEGYRIGHIEGGMRSYDRRMPEEVNRVICDYVSDLVFVYTPLYKERLLKENKPASSVFVVGNTITEIVKEYAPAGSRSQDYVLADIHRNENLKSPAQLRHILEFLSTMGRRLGLPVKLVRFNRAVKMIAEGNLLEGLSNVEIVGPYGFLAYLELQYHARCLISDSGTAQEEGPLLGVPVIVPRQATERPESVEFGNSVMVGETGPVDEMADRSLAFLRDYQVTPEQVAWLGDGQTSGRIVDILAQELGSGGLA
jgi:UDP-N-acetylglucosamine 2-epimerase (non-hydrolysing)